MSTLAPAPTLLIRLSHPCLRTPPHPHRPTLHSMALVRSPCTPNPRHATPDVLFSPCPVAALTQDDQDAGEIRKFEKLLRAEQESGLTLSRQLQAIKARATDTTNKFMLQRRLVEKQRDWALERPALEERILALQRKANATVAEAAGPREVAPMDVSASS